MAAPAAFAPVRDEKELQRVRQTYGIERDYILSVGSIQPRKNLGRLIEAYSLLRGEQTEGKLPQLVLVGKNAWLYDETLRSLKDRNVGTSIILTGYVPELICRHYTQERFVLFIHHTSKAWLAAPGSNEVWRAGDRRQPDKLA